MKMYYGDKREAVVNIMWELVRRGWNTYGYREDQSDMMTDYYSPAYWEGIAEKDGYILLIDVHGTGCSGKQVTEQGYNIDHSKIRKLEALRDDAAASEGEKRNCQAQIDRMYQKAEQSKVIKEQFPTFSHGNPRRSNWHIEKDGIILDKGNGAFKCYVSNSHTKENKQELTKRINAFCDRVEKSMKDNTQLVKKMVTEAITKTVPVEVEKTQVTESEFVNGLTFIMKVDYTHGNYKGSKHELVRVFEDGTWGYFAKHGRRGKPSKSSANQWLVTFKRLNELLQKGHIAIVEMQEVTETIEKEIFVKTARTVKDNVRSEEEILTINEGTQAEQQTDAKENTHNSLNEKSLDVSFKLNQEMNGIEVYFSEKPSGEVIETLKLNGFRWSKRGFWYTKQTDERLELVKSLTGTNDSEETETSITESISYPEIDIDDIEQYVVSETLQKREHDSNWIFRQKEYDRTKEIQELFQHYNSKVKEVLQDATNERIAYYLKKALQSFKKNYFSNYIKRLENRANNPNWAVTGRANRSVRKVEKANNRYDNLMRESIEIEDKFKKSLRRAKNDIMREEKEKARRQLENTTNNIEFKVETKELDIYGHKKKFRVYTYMDYLIVKVWGCFRIFKNGQEVGELKTTDTLETAKKYVSMLIHQERKVV